MPRGPFSSVAVACWLALGGCASSSSNQPPPAPAYDPVGTPEAETKCPDERKAAQTAREMHLDLDTGESRRKAALAVVAHGRCEEVQFVKWEIAGGSMQVLTDQISQARSQMNTARVLYEEAVNYNVPEATVGGFTGLGNLHREFARKLRGLTPPPDVEQGLGAAQFEEEVDTLAKSLDQAAFDAYQQALETLSAAPDMEGSDRRVTEWRRESCTGLKALAGPGRQVHPLCI